VSNSDSAGQPLIARATVAQAEMQVGLVAGLGEKQFNAKNGAYRTPRE